MPVTSGGGRSDRDDRGHARADAVEEVVRDARRAILGGVGVADGREDAVRDVARRGRPRHPGRTAERCTASASAKRCRLADEQLVGAHGRLGWASRRSAAPIDADALAAESEPRERIARADSALERRAHQLGATAGAARRRRHAPAAGAGRRASRHPAVAAVRSSVRGPSIAAQTEPSTSSPARTPIAMRCVVRPSAAELDGVDDDRPVVAVQVAEDAALGEDPRVALGHLAADDRLGPRGVGLLLPPREGEDARGAVLDRHGRVEQCRDRVGDGEQVARGQAADRLVLGVADVAVGEERPQQGGELRPGRAAGETQQATPDASIAARIVIVEFDGRAHDERDGAVLAERRVTSGGDADRLGDADAEHERALGVGRLVEGVVDDDAADVVRSPRPHRGRGRAA